MKKNKQELLSIDPAKFGFKDKIKYVYQTEKGLSEKVVREISKIKNEPGWMLAFRLKALEHFEKKPMPSWGPSLKELDFDKIIYYIKPSERTEKKWEDVPEKIKQTFEKLGIPEAERRFLGGVGAQYDSEMVYHKIRGDLEKLGVIFLDMGSAVKKHPEIVKKYISTVVPVQDNKFAALNSAVWSGGSFIYVPKGVKVEVPLQAYFRINAQNIGQFERTLIIADEGSSVHFIEGCTAPLYTTASLHAAVVEIIAMKDAKVRYTTIQNWSKNVYNLVTKRAFAYEGATVEWVDGNIGSKTTMKYPAVYLKGKGAKAELLSIAYASKGQNIDAGGKAIHLAPNTSSKLISKSISRADGKTTFRGYVKVIKGATDSKSYTKCDALILDETAHSETVPQLDVNENKVSVGHEATVGRIGEAQLFYLMSRGLSEQEATTMIVMGFFQPFVKELPLDYAVELNRLIQLEMEGAIC